MKPLQKIASLLLSALLFVGTTGFTVEKFYCGTHLRSIHIITTPTPCCADPGTPKGKCHTETEYVKADLNADRPIEAKKAEQIVVPMAFVPVSTSVLPSWTTYYPPEYLNYRPPLRIRNIPVLFSSFLI